MLRRGNDIAQMMKVVGDEGTSVADFIVYLKSELLDAAYLQQDSFHEIDGACSAKRQRHMFALLLDILRADIAIDDRDKARSFFQKLTQALRDWNYIAMDAPEFAAQEKTIRESLASAVRAE